MCVGETKNMIILFGYLISLTIFAVQQASQSVSVHHAQIENVFRLSLAIAVII